MALTRDFKETVVARVERDPTFAKGLLDEATTLLIGGEAETARVILRDLVNATLGFEQLAKVTDVPSKSLHRMLSPKGNPSMDNLAAIFGAVSGRISRGTPMTRQRKVAQSFGPRSRKAPGRLPFELKVPNAGTRTAMAETEQLLRSRRGRF